MSTSWRRASDNARPTRSSLSFVIAIAWLSGCRSATGSDGAESGSGDAARPDSATYADAAADGAPDDATNDTGQLSDSSVTVDARTDAPTADATASDAPAETATADAAYDSPTEGAASDAPVDVVDDSPAEASDGAPTACETYCDCLDRTCSTHSDYTYSGYSECLTACATFSPAQLGCWAVFCRQAEVTVDPFDREHACSHAIGVFDLDEC